MVIALWLGVIAYGLGLSVQTARWATVNLNHYRWAVLWPAALVWSIHKRIPLLLGEEARLRRRIRQAEHRRKLLLLEEQALGAELALERARDEVDCRMNAAVGILS